MEANSAHGESAWADGNKFGYSHLTASIMIEYTHSTHSDAPIHLQCYNGGYFYGERV
jgi:hypothetical protein